MRRIVTGSVIANRYRVEKRLGSGGFGTVYLVEDLQLPGEVFALKVLKLDEGVDVRRINRFRREARVLLKLAHPNIVTMRHFMQIGHVPCYAMDYVDGPTLRKLLAQEGPLDVPRALRLTRQVLKALAVAHRKGVVHRDVKPDNVLVAEAGRAGEHARVLDFGIAKVLEGTMSGTAQGGFVGTPAYMSPEQCGGDAKTDPCSDIYSVGCVLYHLLTGRAPFVSDTVIGYVAQHRFEPVPPFSETAPDRHLPSELEQVVLRALEKNPADRFRSVEEMIDAIDGLETLSQQRPAQRPRRALTGADRRAPQTVDMRRARLDLPPGASQDGIRTVYVFGGRILRLGRSRPEQQSGLEHNNLVLRVLPCRGLRIDPKNFAATKKISSSHATISEADGVLLLTDHSVVGTWIENARVTKGRSASLSNRFRLCLAGVLDLDMRVVPSDARPGRPVEAVLIRRLDNEPSHAYLWVLRRALIGRGEQCLLRLSGSMRGRIEAGDDSLRFFLSPEIAIHQSRTGDEARTGSDAGNP
ncbi:protein kinase [Planctomycetota bacterium]